MKVTAILSTLLVVVPSLVNALPAAVVVEEQDLTLRDNVIIARAESCNAPVPTDKKKRAAYDRQIKVMKKATAEAHQSQDACPESKKATFAADKNKQSRQLTKSNCVTNWTRSKSKRQDANNVCAGLGGTIDWGHNNAVAFCDTQIAWWNSQTP